MFNYILHYINNITQHIKHAKGYSKKDVTLLKKEKTHAIEVHAKGNRQIHMNRDKSNSTYTTIKNIAQKTT